MIDDARMFTARFDDCEVIHPDDPEFSLGVPGDGEVLSRARRWAEAHGFSQLVGINGWCPHVLTSDMAWREVQSHWGRGVSSVVDQLAAHLTGGLDGLNDRRCVFYGSLDHVSFWVNRRWPTAPFMLWFPYRDPSAIFEVLDSPVECSELLTDRAGPQAGLGVNVWPSHDVSAADESRWFWNWYGYGSHRVEVKSGWPLGEHEARMLRSAWQHAEVMAQLRRMGGTS